MSSRGGTYEILSRGRVLLALWVGARLKLMRIERKPRGTAIPLREVRLLLKLFPKRLSLCVRVVGEIVETLNAPGRVGRLLGDVGVTAADLQKSTRSVPPHERHAAQSNQQQQRAEAEREPASSALVHLTSVHKIRSEKRDLTA